MVRNHLELQATAFGPARAGLEEGSVPSCFTRVPKSKGFGLQSKEIWATTSQMWFFLPTNHLISKWFPLVCTCWNRSYCHRLQTMQPLQPSTVFFHEPHYRFGSNATMYTDRIASYHHLKILPFENATWHHAWELREIYGETDKCTYMLTIAAAMLQSTQLWFHIARSNPWEKPVLHGTMGGFIQPTLERYFFETFVLLIYCKFVLGGAPTKLQPGPNLLLLPHIPSFLATGRSAIMFCTSLEPILTSLGQGLM